MPYVLVIGQLLWVTSFLRVFMICDRILTMQFTWFQFLLILPTIHKPYFLIGNYVFVIITANPANGNERNQVHRNEFQKYTVK